MTREHLFPLWLINYAEAHKEGISWAGQEGINPKNATLPLCADCNHHLGSELEAPVSRILPRVGAGDGLSNLEAELVIRWLWKFEGLISSYTRAGSFNWHYSDRWTLISRVLGDGIKILGEKVFLAIGLIHANDPQFHDWPMGLDSGINHLDGFFVSGVFGRVALMTGLRRFEHLIPRCFGITHLNNSVQTDSPSFKPPVCFPLGTDAIEVTKLASVVLAEAHETFARQQAERRQLTIERQTIIIPNR